MKKMLPLWIISALLIIGACSSDTNTATEQVIEGTPESKLTFDVQPAENATLAQAQQAMNKATRERHESGRLKKENFPALISQVLGVLEKNPGDNNARTLCFDAAEVLKVGQDYENAAKLYLKVIQVFPKSDAVGQAQFQLAYMQENQMKDTKAAIVNYTAFLQDYPNHPAENIASERLRVLMANN